MDCDFCCETLHATDFMIAYFQDKTSASVCNFLCARNLATVWSVALVPTVSPYGTPERAQEIREENRQLDVALVALASPTDASLPDVCTDGLPVPTHPLRATLDVLAIGYSPLQGTDYMHDYPFLPSSTPMVQFSSPTCELPQSYNPYCPQSTVDSLMSHTFEAIGISLLFLAFLVIVLLNLNWS